MRRVLRYAGLGLVALVATGYFTLVRGGGELPDDCGKVIDVTALRQLAATMGPDRPREVRVERVGRVEMPEAVVFTGGRFGMTPMQIYAYQIAFADHSIIVDTGFDDQQAQRAHASEFDPTAWGHVKAAMLTASDVYVTHEHVDHVGGALAVAGSLPRLDALHLTPQQIAHLELARPAEAPADLVARVKPFDYDGARAVAPGVVLVKAAGHTPGSQWAFVQLADGRELLLLGDTAWHTDNIDRRTGPPKLTSLLLHNDRHANACQLMALDELQHSEPRIRQMPGHDGPRMEALLKEGLLTQGFR